MYDRTYLLSPHWQELRAIVHARSGGWCERCHRRRGVNVHHLHYRTLYREDPVDLLHLCRPCHRAAHGRHRFNPITIVFYAVVAISLAILFFG